MVRGKEHGWTTSQLFGVFLEVKQMKECACGLNVLVDCRGGFQAPKYGDGNIYIVVWTCTVCGQLLQGRSARNRLARHFDLCLETQTTRGM